MQALQAQYDGSIATKERLTNESATLTMKLERADQLVNGLSGERTRCVLSCCDNMRALLRQLARSVAITRGVLSWDYILTTRPAL